MTDIHHDLTLWIEFYVRTIHGPRRGTFEIDSLGVITTAMARALEFVLTRLPIRSASQVCTHSPDHEDALGVSHHPDSMLALKFAVDSKAEIAGIADFELGLGFIQNAREEEAQKHQKVDT